MTTPFIHPSAIVDAGAELGPSVRVWHFTHVMNRAVIGEGSQLGQNCFVGEGVRIGARVRVQNNVSLYEGVELEDEVFVGPSVVFTNVLNPRAVVSRRKEFRRTLVRTGASLGANATILPGVTLGGYCMVGAGSVVLADVRPFAVVVGAPAREVGWMSRHGERLEFEQGVAVCPATGERYRLGESGVELV
jgi:UDP-2-acetamido-3-amino-2,3-dideoxy-glucuronate N-acetyltransferase